MHLPTKPQFSISTREGILFINPQLIIHCEADRNYCTLHLANNKKLFVCRQLGQLEAILPAPDFVRVHHSHLVNLVYLEKFCRENGGCLVLTNGAVVPVARRKRAKVMARFRENVRME